MPKVEFNTPDIATAISKNSTAPSKFIKTRLAQHKYALLLFYHAKIGCELNIICIQESQQQQKILANEWNLMNIILGFCQKRDGN